MQQKWQAKRHSSMEVLRLQINVSIKYLEKTRRILSHDYSMDNNKLLHQLGLDIVDEARSNLQNNTHVYTGDLNASIRILGEAKESITVGTDIPYAGYIEYGRGPVRPINAKFLHFFTKDGKEVFTKFSKATEPSPFLEPAVILKTQKFSDVYAENTSQTVRSLV